MSAEQKMASLRVEADESHAKVEELQAKIKTLEQETLQKEHEITSLTHKNSQLEGEVEKLENTVKDLKAGAEEGTTATTQNETLQRRLQLLEEEAEEADKNLRETNDKYALFSAFTFITLRKACKLIYPGFVKPMSRLVTSNVKCKLSSKTVISGSKSSRRWPRNTLLSRRSWRISNKRLATCKSSICWLANVFWAEDVRDVH
jgi:predicted RNase H-like nuclease (RuvC/YqgF family)